LLRNQLIEFEAVGFVSTKRLKYRTLKQLGRRGAVFWAIVTRQYDEAAFNSSPGLTKGLGRREEQQEVM
jgi:hypothetical protein